MNLLPRIDNTATVSKIFLYTIERRLRSSMENWGPKLSTISFICSTTSGASAEAVRELSSLTFGVSNVCKELSAREGWSLVFVVSSNIVSSQCPSHLQVAGVIASSLFKLVVLQQ
jgi:hypothetical protein